MGESEQPSTERAEMILDFQSAPFEALCGCVGILIPSHRLFMYDKGANLAETERLIREGVGSRIVEANCPKCHGVGLKPIHIFKVGTVVHTFKDTMPSSTG